MPGSAHQDTLSATDTLIDVLLESDKVGEARLVGKESRQFARSAYGESGQETIEANNRLVQTLLQSADDLPMDLPVAEVVQ